MLWGSMGTVQLKPFSSNQIEKTQKKGTVQLNFSFQSLYNCEVRLFRRISVGPFPNNNLTCWSKGNLNSEEGNGPTKFFIHSPWLQYYKSTANEKFIWTVPLYWVTSNIFLMQRVEVGPFPMIQPMSSSKRRYNYFNKLNYY